MKSALANDEDLLRRLPLPLAQLYRRALNAKTSLERHQAAYYLWEAALKLLASVAVVEYAERDVHDPLLAERLHNLARPAVGHWWEFVRSLVPVLADGDASFAPVRDLVLGRTRDDLPRTAGLDAALSETLDARGGARSTVRLTELFDRLVRYRNREVGHGAAGQRPPDFYDRMGQSLMAGVVELLGRLDVLAGRRLLYVADVRRQGSGSWLVDRYELIGESAKRIESLELSESEGLRRILPDRIHLELPIPGQKELTNPPILRLLHPLVVYDFDTNNVLFLNARRGRQRTEYLCYRSGEVSYRQDLGKEQRDLLARVLDLPVDDRQVEQWAAQSQAEEHGAGSEEPLGLQLRRLGEFELLSELGRGGMGVVYRAWQPSLGRQVALKCMFQSGDRKAEARFAREIHALGQVEHPNLVKIFTSGAEGDQWFYAMELIEGAVLSAVCDRLTASSSSAAGLDVSTWQQAVATVCEESRQAEKPLSDPAASGGASARRGKSDSSASIAHSSQADHVGLTPRRSLGDPSYVRHISQLILQVAEAAYALHETGVIHRDIKPGNIIVTPEGTQAVLMDLGLAQVADEVEGRLTRTRQFVGTLRYASPEQVLAVRKLDRRSDVYSLGATLWELVTLRPLFGATEQTPTPALMEKIQHDEPESIRRYHPGMAKDLEAIVHKCLEKDPRKRYATANELAEDLRRFLGDEPVLARPVRGWERGWKWVKRRPALAALWGLGCLAILALVGVIVGLFYNSRLQDANANLQTAVKEAENQRQRAEEEKAKADFQRDEADRQRTNAEQQHHNAEQQRAEADRQRARAEGLQYLADMNLAQRGWDKNQIALVLSLLERHRPKGPNEPDRRGFEWYYLWRLCHSEPVSISGDIYQVAFSPDGRRLAGSVKGVLKVWDAATGTEVLSLHRQDEFFGGPVFSPDGRYLATGIYRKGQSIRVQLVDGATGQDIFAFDSHTEQPGRLTFSPDGRLLAFASTEEGKVQVWDLTTRQETVTLQGFPGRLFGVAFSPDGHSLAAGGSDPQGVQIVEGFGPGIIVLWDTTTGKEILTLRGHGLQVLDVAFRPDGKHLASASNDQTVKVWDTANGKNILTLKAESREGALYVAYSPDGTRVASAGADQIVRVWDATTGEQIFALKGHTNTITGLVFSPDATRLASVSDDQSVKVWDATSGQESFTFQVNMELNVLNVTSLAFSSDGNRVAAAAGDVKIWDAATGQELLTLADPGGTIMGVAFSPDNKLVATGELMMERESGTLVGIVNLWDAITGNQVLTFQGKPGAVNAVTFDPDGKRLAASCGDGTVRVWETTTGKEIRSLKVRAPIVTSVAFSPDGHLLAGGTLGIEGDTVQIWDMGTGQEVHTLKGHTAEAVTSVAFSPNGRLIASGGGRDHTAKLWDATTWKELATLQGHTGDVTCVAFSSDSRRLVSSGGDKLLKVWDVATGQEVLTLEGHTQGIHSVVFSPDGKQIASAGDDRTVKLWDAREPNPQEQAVRREALQIRWQAWQRQQAEACEQHGLWFAAVFHLSRLLDVGPENIKLRKRRLNGYAELGDWERTDADMKKVLEVQPDWASNWSRQARLHLLQTGDRASYRKACQAIVEHFGETDEAADAYSVARACVLIPDAVADHYKTLKLAELAKRRDDKDHSNLQVFGAALYRAGEYERSVQILQDAIAAYNGDPLDWLFLAMAHQRLGHVEQAKDLPALAARAAGLGALPPGIGPLAAGAALATGRAEANRRLERAVRWMDRHLSASQENLHPGSIVTWEQRLELKLLRQEAEALIQHPGQK